MNEMILYIFYKTWAKRTAVRIIKSHKQNMTIIVEEIYAHALIQGGLGTLHNYHQTVYHRKILMLIIVGNRRGHPRRRWIKKITYLKYPPI